MSTMYLKNKGVRLIMAKNTKIDFLELESLAEFDGSDDRSVKPQAVSPVVSVTHKICLPTVSAFTTFLYCNRFCGWGCKK